MEELSLGIEEMDTIHQEFVMLLEQVKSSKGNAFIVKFNTLLEHTQEHFAAEGENHDESTAHEEGMHDEEMPEHDHEEHMGSEDELQLTATGVLVEKVST